jgi:hypothetical protein
MNGTISVENLFERTTDEEVGQALLRFAQTISRDQAAAVICTMVDFVAFAEKLLSK